MTKQQLAESAGVSVRTLNRWCEPYRQELEESKHPTPFWV